MPKKPGPLSALAQRLSLPPEALSGELKLTAQGFGRALIENHRGVNKYTRELIEVEAGKFSLRVTGEGLELVAMSHSDLIISGRIFTFEYI